MNESWVRLVFCYKVHFRLEKYIITASKWLEHKRSRTKGHILSTEKNACKPVIPH